MPPIPFPLSFSMKIPAIKSLKHPHSSFLRNHQLSNRAFLLPPTPHITPFLLLSQQLLLYHTHHNIPSLSTTSTTTPSLPPLDFSSLLYTQHLPLYHTHHNITPSFHLTFSPTLTTLLVYFYYIRFPSSLFPPSLPFSPSHPLLFSFLFSRSRPYDRLLSFILW